MKRFILDDLKKWLSDPYRKPMILRGARQVGKTWCVRELAQETGRQLVEINFERHPEYADLFAGNDPQEILTQLEIVLNLTISRENAVLFLDEIQAASEVIPKLRWFYEEMPELAVIAAGSLLEFALEEHDFSVPVGRVTYCFLGPMSFAEFLWACGEEKLAAALKKSAESMEISDVVHEKASRLFREYMIVGGMPAVVNAWVQSGQITACSHIQTDLLQTYRDDFNKYRKRISPELLRKTMESVVKQLGCRFMYSNVTTDDRQPNVKSALHMLELAGLCTKVRRTSANGLPLGAEADEKLFKTIFLDTGLALNLLGYRPADQEEWREILWANKGALAEQIVGQELIAARRPGETQLYYWQQSGSGNGEIDYLIASDGRITPIEVKAGASGSMKALHGFMQKKGLARAVRFDTNKPSQMTVQVKTNQGLEVAYELASFPLYMAGVWNAG